MAIQQRVLPLFAVDTEVRLPVTIAVPSSTVTGSGRSTNRHIGAVGSCDQGSNNDDEESFTTGPCGQHDGPVRLERGSPALTARAVVTQPGLYLEENTWFEPLTLPHTGTGWCENC